MLVLILVLVLAGFGAGGLLAAFSCRALARVALACGFERARLGGAALRAAAAPGAERLAGCAERAALLRRALVLGLLLLGAGKIAFFMGFFEGWGMPHSRPSLPTTNTARDRNTVRKCIAHRGRLGARLGSAPVSFSLFDVAPLLSARLSRVALGEFPTPVESLSALSRALSAASDGAWVKRDDLSSPVYGGNKVRTLELLFGDALARGKSRVFATGAFGSNHALATALHAPRVGLEPCALLFPQPVSQAALSNLRALSESRATLRALPHWSALPFGMAWLRVGSAERAPYVMVPGGATPLGALGYVSAGLELGRQIAAHDLPVPRRVIVGVGSTCTSAGLLVGLALAGHFRLGFEPALRPRLTSVRVSPWPVTSRLRILSLATRTARLLHELSERSLPLFDSATLGARFEVDGNYLGPGYGIPSRAGDEAEELWRRCELAALDGTYSAKAAARVVAGLRGDEPGPVLFWSTKSSVPLPEASSIERSPTPSRVVPAAMRSWLLHAERTLREA